VRHKTIPFIKSDREFNHFVYNNSYRRLDQPNGNRLYRIYTNYTICNIVYILYYRSENNCVYMEEEQTGIVPIVCQLLTKDFQTIFTEPSIFNDYVNCLIEYFSVNLITDKNECC
jgi:hypothetical protein